MTATGEYRRCKNHPDVAAAFVARMPSAVKQVDGEYREDVPLCEPCAVNVEAIGFPIRPEFGEGWGANLRLVRRDGVVVVQLRCPDCQRWADIDDDQLHGRVSVDHTPGCGYHETHDWYALAVDESGRIPVHIDGDRA